MSTAMADTGKGIVFREKPYVGAYSISEVGSKGGGKIGDTALGGKPALLHILGASGRGLYLFHRDFRVGVDELAQANERIRLSVDAVDDALLQGVQDVLPNSVSGRAIGHSAGKSDRPRKYVRRRIY